MFFIDGDREHATINGTGMEDCFNNAWMFQNEFSYRLLDY